MKLIRERYLTAIEKARESHKVILISGLSGSGKSTLLADFAHRLRGETPPIRIVQTGIREEAITSDQLLADARALGAGKSALFVDNADETFAAAIGEIAQNYATKVFVSGKNTVKLETALSGKMGSDLAVVRCGPLLYGEFLSFHGLLESRRSLELYAWAGGLPDAAIIAPESPNVEKLLAWQANSFILTDIIEGNRVRNPEHVKALLRLIASSTGEALSARSVRDAFDADRATISPQAALDYLKLCRDSGIVVPLPVYDVSAEKGVDAGSAWYFSDNGLRAPFVTRSSAAESDRAIENLVCVRLRDDGWSLTQARVGGSNRPKEKISFLGRKDGEKAYFQVCGSAITAGERLRRRQALLDVRDAWPKYLIEADEEDTRDDGIRRIPPRDFLLNGIA